MLNPLNESLQSMSRPTGTTMEFPSGYSPWKQSSHPVFHFPLLSYFSSKFLNTSTENATCFHPGFSSRFPFWNLWSEQVCSETNPGSKSCSSGIILICPSRVLGAVSLKDTLAGRKGQWRFLAQEKDREREWVVGRLDN